MNSATQLLLDENEGRLVFRLYLGTEAAQTLNISPSASGRTHIDQNTTGIQRIQVKSGWFVVQGTGGQLQQFYVNPDHVVAFVWLTDEDVDDGT